MGQQIAIAQAEEDERSATEWLLSRSGLLCLPRLSLEAHPEPRRLGGGEADEQVIFLEEAAPLVLAHWGPCLRWSGQEEGPAEYHVFPKDYACIEWSRTARMEDGRVIAGRYYLNTGENSFLPEPQQQRLRSLMASLTSWIRRSYPLRSTAKYPVHVGPALAAQLAGGTRRLVHGNGVTPVELAEP